MSEVQAKAFVGALYDHILQRTPQTAEFDNWVKAYGLHGAEFVFFAFITCDEYKSRKSVRTATYPGHYYSPVVDPATVHDYVTRERATFRPESSHIDISIDRMEEFWLRSRRAIRDTRFPEEPDGLHRFYYNNEIFPYGDAITLRAMMIDLQPKTVIEIGSGFSSACMLDTADEYQLRTDFIFIDPYCERLQKLLRPQDHARVELIEEPVQSASLDVFKKLGRGDILFIDSTHVLKTGSDVHFELFHILPLLQTGVVVQFHDIQYPFEYPDKWIYELNYSWNEIYALRAFLMYNYSFRVNFWGNYFAQKRTSLVRDSFPLFLKNPGASIWLEKL